MTIALTAVFLIGVIGTLEPRMGFLILGAGALFMLTVRAIVG